MSIADHSPRDTSTSQVSQARGRVISTTKHVPIAECDNVSKWYGPVIGVNDVSFALQPGITGLVGPNGAGKSTLIKLMTGLLRPSLGEVRIQGLPASTAAARAWIGYCPDADSFYEEMSGRRFVRTMARLQGFSRSEARARTDEVLEQVAMSERADRRLGSYSKGMRQRVKLAQALVHDPHLVVLDEPLNGVDPVGRRDLVRLFQMMAEQGRAVLVSSHILEDMDRLASRILFVCRGRILASGSLGEIREMLDNHPLHILISAVEQRELGIALMQLAEVRSVRLEHHADLMVEVDRPGDFFVNFGQLAATRDFGITRMEVSDASTEAIFDYLIRSRAPGAVV